MKATTQCAVEGCRHGDNSWMVPLSIIVCFVVLSVIVSPCRAFADDGITVVSLGDSYSAGEGLGSYYGQNDESNCPDKRYDDNWLLSHSDWLAHRSEGSWPGQLVIPSTSDEPLSESRVALSNISSLFGISTSTTSSTSWYFVASSGATTADLAGTVNDKGEVVGQEKTVTRYDLLDISTPLTLTETFTTYLAPQLDVFDQVTSDGREADYVTITIGGNDMGFTTVVEKAALMSLVSSGYASASDLMKDIDNNTCYYSAAVLSMFAYLETSRFEDYMDEKWEEYDSSIRDQILNAYGDIRDSAGSQAKVIVAGYPELIDDSSDHKPFTQVIERKMNSAVQDFNDELEKLVEEANSQYGSFYFADVESGFSGHSAYSADGEFINGIAIFDDSENLDATVPRGLLSSASFHPNEYGAAVYADVVQEKIKEIEKDEAAKDIVSANSTVYISSDVSVAVLDKDGDALQNYHTEMTVHAGGKYSYYSFDVTEGSFSLDGYGLESLSRASVTITVPGQEGSCRLMMVVTSDGSDEVTIQTDFTSSSGSDASSTTGSGTFDDIPTDATTYNGHSYCFFTDVCDTWEEAEEYCEALGGYLAVINDDAENTYLYDLMISSGITNAYFGYSDADEEDVWKWVKGTSTYANWSSGEPNNERSTEDYAMFYYKSPAYQWNDGNFGHGTVNDSQTFICEWDGVRSSSASTTSERDIVLVLDVSGSMAGDPLDETKEAAVEFVETVFDNDARVSLVTFDNSAELQSDFTQSETLLSREIDGLYTGGGTNMEAGLKMAASQLSSSNASKKIIVLMTDGEPNDGKTGDDLIAYADQIKDDGVTIYTLGFFQSLGTSKSPAQALLEGIASEGCHYEVDDASKLQYFFGDIADQISGQNYIYVRIACPVEVEVSYDGETLSSAGATSSQRTSFGTLTFEDAEESSSTSSGEDDDADTVKILRLKEGVAYDISIDGTGSGEMDYSIGFVDDEGDYSDMRRFNDIEIASTTHIETTAEVGDETTMKIDEDGDGNFETVYRAGVNEEAELVDESWKVGLAIVAVVAVFLAVGCLSLSIGLHRRKKRMARSPYGVR